MNGRQVKKLRRWYNKDLKEKLNKDRAIFENALRMRPRRFPFWLWKRVARFFFTEQFYEPIVKYRGRVGDRHLIELLKKLGRSITIPREVYLRIRKRLTKETKGATIEEDEAQE